MLIYSITGHPFASSATAVPKKVQCMHSTAETKNTIFLSIIASLYAGKLHTDRMAALDVWTGRQQKIIRAYGPTGFGAYMLDTCHCRC